jgi:transposase InsO family protein
MSFLSGRSADNALQKAFYTPDSPVAFSSQSALIKKFKNKIRAPYIINWLAKQPIYSLTRVRKERFPRNKAIAHDVGFVHADLSPHSKAIAKANKNCHQLLVICDTLTRKVDAVLVKNKTSEEMIKGMKTLLKRNKISILFTDRGTDFLSTAFENFLKSKNIKHFYARNKHKSFLAEMSIRRIRERINKYLSHKRTKSFYSLLPAIVEGLNKQYNRNLKFAPSDITTPEAKKQAFENLYLHYLKKSSIVPKLEIGDKVRIAVHNSDFSKNYSRENFSQEIFVISKVFPRKIPVYSVKDLAGEEIIGTWYIQELVKVE